MRDKGALERLQKQLNSRTNHMRLERSGLRARPKNTRHAWQPGARRVRKPRRIGWLEIVFIASLVFFIGAAVFSGFLFFSGNNTVSTRNVNITIDGPTSIRAGDTLPLQVVITNRNAVPMELTDLVVEFPPGTRSETDVTVPLPRIRESIGTIEPGESINRTIRSVIFGSADTTAEVAVSVEYRVPSSNAIFLSEASYKLPISQSPASITVESLKEVVSGQVTALTVTVTSNVTDVLSNMLLVAEYPPGFSFQSATPAPSTGSNTWRLGDIEQNGKRTVTIRGTFTGEDGDERVVHFTTGGQNGASGEEIAAPLATGDVTLALAKPFVSLALSLDGTVSTEHVASRGKAVRGDIRWVNNVPGRVQDVEIKVLLAGSVLDRSSVVAERGFWRSADNTVVFSRETNPALADVAPGASGVLSFSFAPRQASDGVFRSPEIGISANLSARRITEAQVPEAIQSSTEARVLVATDLALQSGVSHTEGPLPPKADSESTYTVSWTVTNSSNELANTSVSAILPSYVRFVGPLTGENISYSVIGGTVTWNIGDLSAGASKMASFQIALTPSLSQVGNQPTLISDQRVFGFDRFTRTQIERTAPTLNTGTGVSSQQGSVVP